MRTYICESMPSDPCTSWKWHHMYTRSNTYTLKYMFFSTAQGRECSACLQVALIHTKYPHIGNLDIKEHDFKMQLSELPLVKQVWSVTSDLLQIQSSVESRINSEGNDIHAAQFTTKHLSVQAFVFSLIISNRKSQDSQLALSININYRLGKWSKNRKKIESCKGSK